jgi:hypothetical protein
MRQYPDRACQAEGCGNLIPWPKRVRPLKEWARRQYCSRPCAARSVMKRPDVIEKHKAQAVSRFDDPNYRERNAQICRANAPIAASKADHAKGGATRSRLAIGWIPQELMHTYVRARELHGAREAKRMIREHLAVVARREVQANIAKMRAKHEREQREAY